MGDQDHIGENLRAYMQAFSPAVRDIFESFDFHTQIDRLAQGRARTASGSGARKTRASGGCRIFLRYPSRFVAGLVIFKSVVNWQPGHAHVKAGL